MIASIFRFYRERPSAAPTPTPSGEPIAKPRADNGTGVVDRVGSPVSKGNAPQSQAQINPKPYAPKPDDEPQLKACLNIGMQNIKGLTNLTGQVKGNANGEGGDIPEVPVGPNVIPEVPVGVNTQSDIRDMASKKTTFASLVRLRKDGLFSELDPEALMVEFRDIGSNSMLSHIATSFDNQVRVIQRNFKMIHVIHDRIKSDLRGSTEANGLRAAKEAVEESVAEAKRKIADLETELKFTQARAVLAEGKIKVAEENASTAVSKWAELISKVQSTEKELSLAHAETAEAQKHRDIISLHAWSLKEKLEQSTSVVNTLEKDLASKEFDIVAKTYHVNFLENRVASIKSLLDKSIAKAEALVKEQVILADQRKTERDRALASRTKLIDRAERKIADVLANATKEGFANCLEQISLCPGAPSREELSAATSYFKVVRDGTIVEPSDDDEEPDISLEVSDLDIGSGEEEGN